jgi:thymidylate kinase
MWHDARMRRPEVIAFVGTVGAGKSTQMRLLASNLQSMGFKVKMTSIKTGHLFGRLIIAALVKLLLPKRSDVFPIRALYETKPLIFRKLFRLWIATEVLGFCMRFIFHIYIPLRLGYIVLAEEYVPGTIADYFYLSRVLGVKPQGFDYASNMVLKCLQMGGPTCIIFLDADTSILNLRGQRRGTLEEKPDYLLMQRTLLLSLSKSLSSYEPISIDTSFQNPIETHEQIMLCLRKLFGKEDPTH